MYGTALYVHIYTEACAILEYGVEQDKETQGKHIQTISTQLNYKHLKVLHCSIISQNIKFKIQNLNYPVNYEKKK